MKQIVCKQLANGIFRITDAEYAGKLTLTERYSILTPVCEQCTDNASYDSANQTIKAGKVELKLSFRPDTDDEFWKKSSGYLLEKFKDKHLNHVVAEGNPNTDIELPDDNAASLISSDVHFGITVDVGEKERFYGLGEASRDKLELRGRSYQNWTYYQ